VAEPTDHDATFMTGQTELPFETLDFLHAPSQELATDLDYFSRVLGGRVLRAESGERKQLIAMQLP
jgi:hypothetical protein